MNLADIKLDFNKDLTYETLDLAFNTDASFSTYQQISIGFKAKIITPIINLDDKFQSYWETDSGFGSLNVMFFPIEYQNFCTMPFNNSSYNAAILNNEDTPIKLIHLEFNFLFDGNQVNMELENPYSQSHFSEFSWIRGLGLKTEYDCSIEVVYSPKIDNYNGSGEYSDPKWIRSQVRFIIMDVNDYSSKIWNACHKLPEGSFIQKVPNVRKRTNWHIINQPCEFQRLFNETTVYPYSCINLKHGVLLSRLPSIVFSIVTFFLFTIFLVFFEGHSLIDESRWLSVFLVLYCGIFIPVKLIILTIKDCIFSFKCINECYVLSSILSSYNLRQLSSNHLKSSKSDTPATERLKENFGVYFNAFGENFTNTIRAIFGWGIIFTVLYSVLYFFKI